MVVSFSFLDDLLTAQGTRTTVVISSNIEKEFLWGVQSIYSYIGVTSVVLCGYSMAVTSTG